MIENQVQPSPQLEKNLQQPQLTSQKSWIPFQVFSILVLLIVATFTVYFGGSIQRQQPSLTVVAEHTVQVPIEKIVFVAQYTRREAERSQLVSASTADIERLLTSLQLGNVIQIELSAPQVTPTQSSTFELRQQMRVTLSDPLLYAQVKEALSSPYISLAQTGFVPQNELQVRSDTISQAVETARTKATLSAASSGKKIGSVLNIVEGQAEEAADVLSVQAGSSMQAAPTLMQVKAAVAVTFALN